MPKILRSTMKTTLCYTTFNRGQQLGYSLARLEYLTLPDELIIIDDGSEDKTFDIIHQELLNLKEKGVSVRYFYRDHPIYDVCSIPRNIALKHATGEVLIISEPEVLFVTDVIKEFMELMEKFPEHIITAGRVYFTNPATEFTPELLVKNPQEQMKSWDIRPFPNGFYADYPANVVTDFQYPTAPFAGAFKTEWLRAINGWDEDMSIINGGGGYGFDDTDVLTRLRENHLNQVRENDITIIHQWHQRPFGTTQHGNTADGWAVNEKIMYAKNKVVPNEDGSSFTTIDREKIIANKDREWGSVDKVTEREI